MTPLEKYANLVGVVLPFAAAIVAIALSWNQLVTATDLAILGAMYLLTAVGVTVGYHRLLTHRAFQTYAPLRYLFAAARLDGRAGLGDRLGRRPPQTPRAHRRRGRSPLAARRAWGRPRRRPARPLARPHGLADGLARAGGLAPVRTRPLRGPRDALDQPALRRARRPRPGDSGAAPASCSAERSRARRRRCSGAASCGSSSSITSPGASTPSATSSALAASRPRTARPTSSGWRCPRSESPGITTTTPSRAPQPTGCAGMSPIRARLIIGAMERLGLAWDVIRISPERQRQRLEHSAGTQAG